jgi:Stigma-specific protein, Stig1
MNEAFDELAKALAEDVSRREALRRVGGVLAGTLLASFGLKTAWGACPQGKTLCSGKCVNLQTDDKNCGSCGTVCSRGQSCVNGTCTSGGGGGGGGGCPSGQTKCNGKCVDLATDPNNCGSCGHVCPYGTNQLCCSGTCVEQWNDRQNCGTCGNTCSSDKFCVSGVCTCEYWQTDCDGTCFNLQNDSANCGSCGHACGSGETCCNWACTSLLSDPNNCGYCNRRCPSNYVCNNGTCACPSNWNICGAGCCPPTSGNLPYVGCLDSPSPCGAYWCYYSDGTNWTYACPS